jgi:vacuolar-type H+-ATPase subunit H
MNESQILSSAQDKIQKINSEFLVSEIKNKGGEIISEAKMKLNKEYNNYIKDIFKKRSKHAFTIIRLLGKTKHETKIKTSVIR